MTASTDLNFGVIVGARPIGLNVSVELSDHTVFTRHGAIKQKEGSLGILVAFPIKCSVSVYNVKKSFSSAIPYALLTNRVLIKRQCQFLSHW